MQRTRNRLGLLSGVTKEFNFSRKKRLLDPVVLTVNSFTLSMSVQSWIDKNPVALYQSKTLLCREAYALLMKTLQEKHPSFYKTIQGRLTVPVKK